MKYFRDIAGTSARTTRVRLPGTSAIILTACAWAACSSLLSGGGSSGALAAAGYAGISSNFIDSWSTRAVYTSYCDEAGEAEAEQHVSPEGVCQRLTPTTSVVYWCNASAPYEHPVLRQLFDASPICSGLPDETNFQLVQTFSCKTTPYVEAHAGHEFVGRKFHVKCAATSDVFVEKSVYKSSGAKMDCGSTSCAAVDSYAANDAVVKQSTRFFPAGANAFDDHQYTTCMTWKVRNYNESNPKQNDFLTCVKPSHFAERPQSCLKAEKGSANKLLYTCGRWAPLNYTWPPGASEQTSGTDASEMPTIARSTFSDDKCTIFTSPFTSSWANMKEGFCPSTPAGFSCQDDQWTKLDNGMLPMGSAPHGMTNGPLLPTGKEAPFCSDCSLGGKTKATHNCTVTSDHPTHQIPLTVLTEPDGDTQAGAAFAKRLSENTTFGNVLVVKRTVCTPGHRVKHATESRFEYDLDEVYISGYCHRLPYGNGSQIFWCGSLARGQKQKMADIRYQRFPESNDCSGVTAGDRFDIAPNQCDVLMGNPPLDDDVILSPFLTDPDWGTRVKYFCSVEANNFYGDLMVQEEEAPAPAPAPDSLLSSSLMAAPASPPPNRDVTDEKLRVQKKGSIFWANLWSTVLPPFNGPSLYPNRKVWKGDEEYNNANTKTQSWKSWLFDLGSTRVSQDLAGLLNDDSDKDAARPRDYTDAPCYYTESRTQVMPDAVSAEEARADNPLLSLKVVQESFYPSGFCLNEGLNDWVKRREAYDKKEGVLQTSEEKTDWLKLKAQAKISPEIRCRGWTPTTMWVSREGCNGTTPETAVAYKNTPWCPRKPSSSNSPQHKEVCMDSSLLDPNRFIERPLTIPINHPLFVLFMALIGFCCCAFCVFSSCWYLLKAKNDPLSTSHLDDAMSTQREKADFVSADYTMKNFYDGYDETDSCLADLPRPRDFCVAFCPCFLRCGQKKVEREKPKPSARSMPESQTLVGSNTDDVPLTEL